MKCYNAEVCYLPLVDMPIRHNLQNSPTLACTAPSVTVGVIGGNCYLLASTTVVIRSTYEVIAEQECFSHICYL